MSSQPNAKAMGAIRTSDCIAVLRLDNCPQQEVHTYAHNGDAIWENLCKSRT
ncbi:hypothetical protein [Pseudomonas sp. R37(2017)]|uniref:hypothetical protein n=1 Tax=Pseudomonas sp. R37(2017) TaxID=1981685 RepID=UPI00130220BC|nr:hypothetical protein [Pseudomonas sp. R37(2017)]